jgi:pimeloyl-ACP methyl ester carboxylesterase
VPDFRDAIPTEIRWRSLYEAENVTVELPSVPDARSTYREVNDIELHAVVAGDPSDPLVVLLHGFPEFWYGWHRQLEPLVNAGFRVLVPDLRGYNASEKPKSVAAYGLETLREDVSALIRSTGATDAHVVGHDWGGVIAWYLGMYDSSVLDQLCILNVPHPLAFLKTLGSDASQVGRSWYMGLFQLPSLPEALWNRYEHSVWENVFVKSTQPDTFTERDRRLYRQAWAQPGAKRGMCNWYRAAVRKPLFPSNESISTPLLLLWGDQDAALIPELADRSLEYCDSAQLERFSGGSHWIHHEFPDRISSVVIDHLQG